MPKLYNTLENLCISRGMKTPNLYIIDGDELNAYASGIDEKSYAITVTRGLVERLNDAEIEAVLGHELTHIINRDCRLMIVTIVFVGMISFATQMLWRSMRFAAYGRSNSRQGGGGALVIMLVASVLLAIGYALAVILRLAISRKREYLADAGSVVLTKNPAAPHPGALRKISGNCEVPHVPTEVRQMFIENPPSIFDCERTFSMNICRTSRPGIAYDLPQAPMRAGPDSYRTARLKISGGEVPHVPTEVRQMFIENPPSIFDCGGLFATHPPIADRIRVLEELGRVFAARGQEHDPRKRRIDFTPVLQGFSAP